MTVMNHMSPFFDWRLVKLIQKSGAVMSRLMYSVAGWEQPVDAKLSIYVYTANVQCGK